MTRERAGAVRSAKPCNNQWTIHLGSTRTVPRARVINKEKSAQSGDRTLAQAR
jgi:hypothetical protein